MQIAERRYKHLYTHSPVPPHAEVGWLASLSHLIDNQPDSKPWLS